ncbi:MAG: hypothetical protein CBC01_07365 [Betaproteobacteria bacterium TMED41]|nr:MAG: hypothetical protein CBC01_07365 [Betaproteobacteria bacterium TMED41]
MVKKSKQFENLNYLQEKNTENIILKEFVNNLNSYTDYLKKNFPNFWTNYYFPNFCADFVISNLNAKETKRTIEVLRQLFEELEIANEKLDFTYAKKIEKEIKCPIVFYNQGIDKSDLNKKNFKEICDFFNFTIRVERIKKKFLAYLAPEGFQHFEKYRIVTKSIILDDVYLNLGRLDCNLNGLIVKKKKYLLNVGVKSPNIFLFFGQFDLFCKNYIHAKGLKLIYEKFNVIHLGRTHELSIQVIQNVFYKSFLTYLALEQLLSVASNFGRELFGGPKNQLAEEGSSVSRYQKHFIDTKLSNKLRKISLLNCIEYQDFFPFRDEYNKKLYLSFINGDSDSLLVPVIVFRYFFVSGKASVFHLPNQSNFMISPAEEELIFKMNMVILNWCSSRFKKCMKYYK